MPSCHKVGKELPPTLHQGILCPSQVGARTPCLRASHSKTSWLRGYVCSYGGAVEILDTHIAIATQLNRPSLHDISRSLRCT